MISNPSSFFLFSENPFLSLPLSLWRYLVRNRFLAGPPPPAPDTTPNAASTISNAPLDDLCLEGDSRSEEGGSVGVTTAVCPSWLMASSGEPERRSRVDGGVAEEEEGGVSCCGGRAAGGVELTASSELSWRKRRSLDSVELKSSGCICTSLAAIFIKIQSLFFDDKYLCRGSIQLRIYVSARLHSFKESFSLLSW